LSGDSKRPSGVHALTRLIGEKLDNVDTNARGDQIRSIIDSSPSKSI
jgi:hypothetical protein